MQTVIRFLLRLVLLAAGLVFAASLLLAVLVLLALWALRMLWARVTGKPVTPFVMRVDPRRGFERMARAADGFGARSRTANADITDVEPREPRT